jgi:hypothetical protein
VYIFDALLLKIHSQCTERILFLHQFLGQDTNDVETNITIKQNVMEYKIIFFKDFNK